MFLDRGVAGKLRILMTRREKFALLGIALLTTVGAALEIAGLGLLMPLVALFTKPELMEQSRFLRPLGDSGLFRDRRSFLAVICIAVVAIYALRALLGFYIVRLQSRFIADKQRTICGRLYRVVMGAPYAFHLAHGSGELIAMMDRAIDMGTELMLPVLLLSSDLITVFFLCIALLAVMPGVMTMCVALFAILGALIYLPLRRLNTRAGREQTEAGLANRALMLEGFSGVKCFKAMGREEHFLERYSRSLEKWLPLRARICELGQLPRIILEFAAILAAIGVFAAMALSGMPDGTLLLSFSLLVAAMSRMLPAFSRIHYNLARIVQSRYSFDSVFSWLNIGAEELHASDGVLTLNDRIEIRNVSFAYPERDVPVLKNFSLTIPSKSSVALTGATGSGKSTLADILLGLLEPDSGGVFSDGRNIRENLASWRSQIGFVPQHIVLFDDTVAANVAFGFAEKPDRARVESVLRTAQLYDFVTTLPQGMDTVIGDNGVRLSGGQRQRLGIARALYGDPQLLILDEATSALDTDTEAALVQALEALRGKLTVVTIAHRLSTIEKCDLRVSLELPADRP